MTIAGFDGIEIEKPVSRISSDEVDTMIENLREQRAEFVEVERASAEGDQVNIDFAGTVNGEAFDGGSAEGTDVVLGSAA